MWNLKVQSIFISILILWEFGNYTTCDDDVRPAITFPDDPEPLLDTGLPYGMEHYSKDTYGADMIGSKLSGRAEFPWIVDIRVSRQDQEGWTTGNIISSEKVMTTCRWALFVLRNFHERLGVNLNQSFPPTSRWNEVSPFVTVYYGDYAAYQPVGGLDRSLFNDKGRHLEGKGSRYVTFMTTHPKCDTDPINNDLSVMELNGAIRPVYPYVSFMPVHMHREDLQIMDFDLSRHASQRIVCFVATFGRNYKNWKSHMAMDYKMKHRAYFEPWSSCASNFSKYLCPDGGSPISDDEPEPATNPCTGALVSVEADEFAKGFKNLMCFNTRATVGTVCDHDNGSPLVCDGEVYGIVVRGAHFDYCSNIYPVPFVVLKITPAAHYYMTLARHPYTIQLNVDGDVLGRSPIPVLSFTVIVFPIVSNFIIKIF